MCNEGLLLVVGGSGQIGQQLFRLLSQSGQTVVATYSVTHGLAWYIWTHQTPKRCQNSLRRSNQPW